MNDIEEQYIARTPRSRALYERASKHLPGGVASNGKFLLPYPIYIQDANGAELVDVDGNTYVDLLMGGGVHILGHAHPAVQAAVAEQQKHAVQLYIPAEAEVRLAEKVSQLMPSIEMVRFLNTGSESTFMALRAARAFRKKDKIVKFEGNFHGQYDVQLMSTLGVEGPYEAPDRHIDSAGIPKNVTADVIILPYNDAAIAAEQIALHAGEIGGVIIEPVSAFGLGVVPADKEFLQAVRDVTEKYDIPLIFDEVVTNFRLALGGAVEYYGIKPDLHCLGKILGGGYAIGGFGGRKDIMDQVVTPRSGFLDLSEQIFQSGCFSGNPISMTAGYTVLDVLDKERDQIYPRLDGLASSLANGLREIGQRKGLPILVNQVASVIQVHFSQTGIRNKRDALKVDKKLANQFHLGLRAGGVMASYHPLFLSTAHTQAHVDRVLEVAEDVLSQMAVAAPVM